MDKQRGIKAKVKKFYEFMKNLAINILKIFLAAITVLGFVFGAFGQQVVKESNSQKTGYDDIYREFKELVKDAQLDFASIRGNVISKDSSEIEYKTTKNYFQSSGFTTTLTYISSEKKYELAIYTNQTNNPAQKQVTNALIELFKFYLLREVNSMSEASYGDYTALYSGNIISMLDAKLTSNGNFKAMRFFSNPAAWTAVNNSLSKIDAGMLAIRVVNASTGLDKTFDELGKILKETGVSSTKTNSSTNYTNLLNQCKDKFKNNDNSKAVELCTQAVSADSSQSEAYYFRGGAYSRMEESDTKSVVSASLGKNQKLAAADFKKCLSLEPTKPRCYSAAGIVLSASTYDAEALEAIKYINEAIRLGDTSDELYLYRANAKRNCYGVSENHDVDAIADYTKFLDSNPTEDLRFDALYGRSLTYMRTRKYEKAVDDLNVLARETQDEEVVYFNRGKAYNELGKYSLALADLNKALELHDLVSQPQWDPARREILSGIERAKKGLGR